MDLGQLLKGVGFMIYIPAVLMILSGSDLSSDAVILVGVALAWIYIKATGMTTYEDYA